MKNQLTELFSALNGPMHKTAVLKTDLQNVFVKTVAGKFKLVVLTNMVGRYMLLTTSLIEFINI